MSNQSVSAEFLEALWEEFLSETDKQTGSKLRSFLQMCKPGTLEGNSLTIIVPNQFLKGFLKKPERLEQLVSSLKICFNNDSAKVDFVVANSDSEADADNQPSPLPSYEEEAGSFNTNQAEKPAAAAGEEFSKPVKSPSDAVKKPLESIDVQPVSEMHNQVSNEGAWQSNLQRNLLFSNFVKSQTNMLAAATAEAVAHSPGKTYNPLFFYSGVGLGKTHLINAIGNYIVKTHPEMRVLYISAEQFTNEYVESLKLKQPERFREKFRNLDVLLIDDIHFIMNKDGTQEELFQTMDKLRREDHQIVISSDCPPKDLNAVKERLKTRFEWGLVADIQPPDFETRVAILSQKASEMEVEVSRDIIDYVASEFNSNIRELEGALTRVITYCSICKKDELNLENAKEALKVLLSQNKSKKIDVPQIKKAVCDYFGISEEDLTGTKRDSAIVRPRQIAMYLCKEMVSGISYPAIGSYFGDRDHTTVMHSYKKVEKHLEDAYYSVAIRNVKEKLK